MSNLHRIIANLKGATGEEIEHELMESYRDELCNLPSFVSEVVLSDEQQRQACKARADGDAILFTKIWDDAIEAWADDEIDCYADRHNLTPYLAAKYLCEYVHNEPQQAAA